MNMTAPAADVMSVQTISIEEWCNDKKVKPCPIQRNTAAHAHRYSRKGGHLSAPHISHQRVSMAVTKKGGKYKLDGHSRAYLWASGRLDYPNKAGTLTVDVYPAEDVQGVMDLYKVFDSSTAVENTGDKMTGGFSYYSFTPQHPTMFTGSTVSAMRVFTFPAKYGADKILSIYDLIEPWIPTFKKMDALHPFSNHVIFQAPIKAAMMLSVLRDGNKALAFWQAYHDETISRTKASKDGMYAARELAEAMRANPHAHVRGYGGIRTYAPIIFYFYNEWSRGKRIPTSLKYLNKAWQKELPPLSELWRDEVGDYFYPDLRGDK